MKGLSRGDWDGFLGLALDNLVQLLLIDALCRVVLGFDAELIYGRVMPGVAVSLLVGNVFYARQARELMQKERRPDVCALPYGINTVSLFAHIFLVMLPAKLVAASAGHPEPQMVAWRAGLVATVGSGLIEAGGSLVAHRLRQAAPRAALLSTLAGIALGFIALGFLFRAYAHPLVGLTTLGIVLLVYFGRVKFRGPLPGGLIALLLGCLVAWTTGLAPVGELDTSALGLHLPSPVVGAWLDAVADGQSTGYLAIIVPMGLFNLVGSIQNLASAEAAGDSFPERPALLVNGVGTLAAAVFGSCFPTTIYIGHPGWKAMGARAGYSVLNAAFFVVVCLTGALAPIAWAIPIDAGMAIVLWIGIVITAQAFQATPLAHAPAVVVGLLPGLGAWGALMAKNGLRAGGYGAPQGPTFGPELITAFQSSDTWIHGAFALEQGFIFTSMILAAMTVALIERRFCIAALWALTASGLSALGVMHSYAFSPADTVLQLKPAWPWAAGYATLALVFVTAPWTTHATHGDPPSAE